MPISADLPVPVPGLPWAQQPPVPARRFIGLRATRCLESRFDIGPAFGPVPFMQCVVRCEQQRAEHPLEHPHMPMSSACGAVAFREVPADDDRAPGGSGAQEETRGTCQLKEARCSLKASVQGRCSYKTSNGRRDPKKRGWCVFSLRRLVWAPHQHPPPDRTCEERRCSAVEATTVAPSGRLDGGGSWTSPDLWPQRWLDPLRPGPARFRPLPQPAAPVVADTTAVAAGGDGQAGASSSEPDAGGDKVEDKVEYYEAVGDGQLAVLGGGLNNMLMGLAQLLTDLCELSPHAALVLPPLDADPLR